MNVRDKVVLITGGSQGIGECLVRTFYAAGAKVFFTGRSEDKLKAVIGRLPDSPGKGTAVYLAGDVKESSKAEEVVDAVQKQGGRIDVLVNNAGVTRDNLILRMKDDEWDDVMATNLKGAFYFTKCAVKYMIRQKSGRVINISSVVGSMGNPGQSNYCASKAGIEGFTRAVAREVASRGVTVNAVAPGYIVTPMTDVLSDDVRKGLVSLIPLNRLGTPEDVANAVLFLASDEASYITGQVVHVNGGMYM